MWCGAVGHPVGTGPGMGTSSWGVRHPVGLLGWPRTLGEWVILGWAGIVLSMRCDLWRDCVWKVFDAIEHDPFLSLRTSCTLLLTFCTLVLTSFLVRCL